MKDSSKNRLVNEIENRLDSFFGENKILSTDPPKDHLEKLKSIVLNIDWEITDDCLSDLINETENLLPNYETDRMAHALLRMLKSLGIYIRKRKAQSHPDAIKRILSVYESFDKIAQDHSIQQDHKKDILIKEINAFKKLKQQVDIKRQVGIQQNSLSAYNSDLDQQRIEQAVSAVEHRLRSEVEMLRKQLSNLQRELDKIRR